MVLEPLNERLTIYIQAGHQEGSCQKMLYLNPHPLNSIEKANHNSMGFIA